jgi:hypothetical protein
MSQALSIWIMPPEPVALDLQLVIDDLSRRYSTPRFRAHVTLIGGVEVIGPAPLASLATMESPEVRAKAIVTSGDYFRCVTASAVLTPSLRALRRKAATLVRASKEKYEPHLSLVYGELSGQQRAAIVRELATLAIPPFRAEALEAVATSGAVEGWRTLYRVRFRA